MAKKRKQWLLIVLVLALASVLLVACDSDEETGATGTGSSDTDGLPARGEALDEQVGGPSDTDAGTEPDESVDYTLDEQRVLTDGVTINAGPDVQVNADNELEEPAFVTSGDIMGTSIVNNNGEEWGNVIEALFAPDGSLRYVVVDSEETAEVEGQTVGTWAIDWNSLTVLTVEHNTVEVTGPYALLTEAASRVAMPVFDTVALTGEDYLVGEQELDLEGNQDNLIRLRALTGFDSLNQELASSNGDSIGTVQELLIAIPEGQIQYLIVDAVSEDNIVIPWDAVQVDENQIAYTLDARVLVDAPTIDDNRLYGDIAYQEFTNEVSQFWEENSAPGS